MGTLMVWPYDHVFVMYALELAYHADRFDWGDVDFLRRGAVLVEGTRASARLENLATEIARRLVPR
jgi:hypothetical protein